MRIFCLSDLHLEFFRTQAAFSEFWKVFLQPKLPKRVDVLILAGDIGYPYPSGSIHAENYKTFLLHCRQLYPHVLLVPGNHEYYASQPSFHREPVLTALQQMCHETQVTLLQQKSISIAGIRFLGTTLWSTIDKTAFKGMNDSRYVFAHHLDYLEAFFDDYQWLRRELANDLVTKTVVVTHHLPTMRLIHPRFFGSSVNSGFATEIVDVLKDRNMLNQVHYWFCGHSHEGMQVHEPPHLKLVLNPLGYPHEHIQQPTDFKTVFELDA